MKMTEKKIETARKMRRKGMSYAEIGKKFEVTTATAWRLTKDGKDNRRKK